MGNDQVADKGTGGFTILYRILITMLIIAVIPLAGLWYITIYKAKTDWTNTIFNTLKFNTETLAKHVDDWTLMNLHLLTQNAKVPDIINMKPVTQNPVLKSMAETYDWVYLAFTVQPDGENVGRSDGKKPKFYGDRDYFTQVMGGKEIGQQVLLGKTTGKPAFILSKAIQAGKIKTDGVLAIAMSLEDISATVARTSIGETGFAILVDAENRLIAHGKGEIANELQDMGGHPVLSYGDRIDQNSFVFEQNGKKIVAFKQKTQMGWNLVVQQDYDEAYAPAVRSQNNAIILLMLTLVMVLVVAYLLATHLSTPIRNLTRIADDISRGNLDATITEVRRSDELGALAKAIERMGVSLQMAFSRLRKTT